MLIDGGGGRKDEKRMDKQIKCELYNDNFQNFKRYGVPKAQLVIADIPYNLGINFYGSNPMWYIDGDNKNGESKLAKKAAFNTDFNFNIAEYMHFCSRLLKPEPKEKGQAPAMIVFCAFEQIPTVVEYGKKHGFVKSYPLFFIKNYSAQVLKANMRVVGATEFGVIFYRDKLPKFNNNGKMVFDWIEYPRDTKTKKIHPTQKPVPLLEKLITLFTDPGEVVIDPVAGSGTTLLAAYNTRRNSYGFECNNKFYHEAADLLKSETEDTQMNLFDFLGDRK